MKKYSLNLNIDWRSKLIDLLIVIAGITIAFKLNNWNETRRSYAESQNYITSFSIENESNKEELNAAIEFCKARKSEIDTLKHLLILGQFEDERIKILVANLLSISDFKPQTTTMENITSSGEFELLNSIRLRKSIITTYNSYKSLTQVESLLLDFVADYLTPYFFENIRFRDFSAINPNFIKDPKFENIILGYDVLLDQKINVYTTTLNKINLLDEDISGYLKNQNNP